MAAKVKSPKQLKLWGKSTKFDLFNTSCHGLFKGS